MRHIALKIAYDGSRFRGSQKQPDVPTVQGELENRLRRLLDDDIKTVMASRTDSGVHAFGNVMSFSTDSPVPPQRIYTLNRRMKYIRIRKIYETTPEFSARFSSRGKTYMYCISTSKHRLPFLNDHFWQPDHIPEPGLMQKAADNFTGTHDFTAFCRKKTPDQDCTRNIRSVKVVTGTQNIRIYIKGNAFLYNMVRFMVYSLYLVGIGKRPAHSIKAMLDYGAHHRPEGKALPGGLYLFRVYYDEGSFLKTY